jgi:hypothetical protein
MGALMISRAFPTAAFARAALELAAQVEADERRIKQAILDAARAGDMALVIGIVERWQNRPAAEVLTGLALPPHGSDQSAAGGGPE